MGASKNQSTVRTLRKLSATSVCLPGCFISMLGDLHGELVFGWRSLVGPTAVYHLLMLTSKIYILRKPDLYQDGRNEDEINGYRFRSPQKPCSNPENGNNLKNPTFPQRFVQAEPQLRVRYWAQELLISISSARPILHRLCFHSFKLIQGIASRDDNEVSFASFCEWFVHSVKAPPTLSEDVILFSCLAICIQVGANQINQL